MDNHKPLFHLCFISLSCIRYLHSLPSVPFTLLHRYSSTHPCFNSPLPFVISTRLPSSPFVIHRHPSIHSSVSSFPRRSGGSKSQPQSSSDHRIPLSQVNVKCFCPVSVFPSCLNCPPVSHAVCFPICRCLVLPVCVCLSLGVVCSPPSLVVSSV